MKLTDYHFCFIHSFQNLPSSRRAEPAPMLAEQWYLRRPQSDVQRKLCVPGKFIILIASILEWRSGCVFIYLLRGSYRFSQSFACWLANILEGRKESDLRAEHFAHEWMNGTWHTRCGGILALLTKNYENTEDWTLGIFVYDFGLNSEGQLYNCGISRGIGGQFRITQRSALRKQLLSV
jgi:hypothetical protein